MATAENYPPQRQSLMTRKGRDQIREEIRAAVDVPRKAVTIAVIALVVACLAFLAVVVSVRHAA